MTIEQQRADFEAWHLQEYGEPAGRFLMWGYYLDPEVQSEWVGSQAGRSTLQSQDREDAERYRWLRQNPYWPEENHIFDSEELDAAIDHARRIEEQE